MAEFNIAVFTWPYCLVAGSKGWYQVSIRTIWPVLFCGHPLPQKPWWRVPSAVGNQTLLTQWCVWLQDNDSYFCSTRTQFLTWILCFLCQIQQLLNFFSREASADKKTRNAICNTNNTISRTRKRGRDLWSTVWKLPHCVCLQQVSNGNYYLTSLRILPWFIGCYS